MILTAPKPLASHHDTTAFVCGVEGLDRWLKQSALTNQDTGASRTFVVCEGNQVVAYYALSYCGVTIQVATDLMPRNMPDQISVVALARLAIHQTNQGRGMGRAMVRDACLRAIAASDVIGIRGLIVHALTAEELAFYERVGFTPSQLDPMTLIATEGDLREWL